ncbi:MAG TPA: biotin transporter BioY [Gammaproteobacteria bacterium]|nr:biotin transporter BioY [Gammaproteobacteria bacterium]
MLNVLRKSISQPLIKIQDSPWLYSLWGAFLLFLCSQVSIPLQPVPITLQTVGVMLVGITFPRKIAVQAVLSYLALGAIGVPVFADFSGGLAVFIGPTAGYLVGFLFAILVMSTIAAKQKNSRNLWSMFGNCCIGTCVVFLFGILGLLPFMNLNHAVQVGLIPFILPGLIKIVLLTICLKFLKPRQQ